MLNIVSEVQLVWEMMSKYFAVVEKICKRSGKYSKKLKKKDCKFKDLTVLKC